MALSRRGINPIDPMVDELLQRSVRLSPTDLIDVDPTIVDGHCQIDPEAKDLSGPLDAVESVSVADCSQGC